MRTILAMTAAVAALGCASEAADPRPAEPGGSETERAPIGKADSLSGSCADGDVCGGPSKGSCWCDEQCSKYGDCCSDYATACGGGGGEGCASAAECADGEQCITGYCVGSATITFDEQWNEIVDGSLVAGASVKIEYDADRLTQCRGDQGGHPAWTIYGNYFASDGSKKSFWVAGHSPDGQTKTPTLVAPPDELEIWFENTSIWGCIGYDSNQGNNYRFDVAPLGG
jgi:hypothetical protein